MSTCSTCPTTSKKSCTGSSCSTGCDTECSPIICNSPVNVLQAAKGKKVVGVIGGGSSALTVMKEITAQGHTAICFETSPRIGGVYTKSYDGTILTTSSLLTAFSDYSDGKEDKPVFWNDEQYLDYLDAFAVKFDLYKNIHFRTRVLKMQKCLKTGKWILTTQGGVYTTPHRSLYRLGCHIPQETRDNALTVGSQILDDFYQRCEAEGFENVKLDYSYKYFDHVTGECAIMTPEDKLQQETPCEQFAVDCVAICTGTNTWACLPTFPGQERFQGKIIHTENYKKPEVFRNQRVLIIGAGESGSDICHEVARHASKVAIAIRGKHGHLIPRKQKDGRVTDLNTNRCRYSNPYILGDWIGWANQHAKRFVAKWSTNVDPVESQILQKIGELNLRQGTSAFSKFGCKNEGFVTAMVKYGAELHRDNFEMFEDKAVFGDGTEFKCDAVLACTGYRNTFPFLERPEVCDEICCSKCAMTHKELACKGCTPRSLYKQIFVPEFPTGEVAFFGFARPAFGSIPPTVEMQSRLYALVISDKIKLPSTKEMVASACKDQCNWETRFGYDAKRVKGLVDFQIYCDDLALQTGSLPPLRSLFFSHPKVWWKIMFGPFTMHQYRLTGPYANQQRAFDVYSRQPVGDFLECSITAAFLITAKILSLLGFKQFTPNNF